MFSKVLKIALLISFIITTSYGAKNILKGSGVKVTYENQYGDEAVVAIKRVHDPVCRDRSKLNGMIPSHIWGDDYAKKSVPDACKKTFVTTIGKISPMKIAEGIDTVGELEVIEFIKKASKDEEMLLVDARMNDWYLKGTIPTAINISFKHFDPKKKPMMFEETADTIGLSIDEGKFDFSEAKTLLLFCNGVWCPQSTWAIENLIAIGYPKEKLKWYRGGMYSWKMLNLTTVTP